MIKIVIPDSGPLISLAKIDRLDLVKCDSHMASKGIARHESNQSVFRMRRC